MSCSHNVLGITNTWISLCTNNWKKYCFYIDNSMIPNILSFTDAYVHTAIFAWININVALYFILDRLHFLVSFFLQTYCNILL